VSRLRQAWHNPVTRELLECVLTQMFRGEPALAAALLAEIDDRCRSPRPDGALAAGLHAFLHDRHGDAFARAFGHDEDARVRRRVLQIADLVPPGEAPQTFADFGCGDGRVTAGLARTWGLPRQRAFGVDVWDRVAEPGAITYVPMRDHRSPLPDAGCDLATLLMVLHHEADPDGLLAEVSRVLSPGGRLLVRESDVGTPDLKLFNAVMEELYFHVLRRLPGVPTPDRHQGADGWEALFHRGGFAVERRLAPEPDNPFTPVHFVLRKPVGIPPAE
jgi:ubiquinone/menaquinone biosynthesis C-methylase UbiE